MGCSSCGQRAQAARDLISGKARTWRISLADGTTATVSSDSEATRLQRQARARMAQKGYTAKRG
jgi:hypothetical protein